MRTHRTPEEWRTLFDEQQRSGLNKTQFCRQHGITRSAFSNARHRLSARHSPEVTFVPALAPDSPACITPLPDTRTDNALVLSDTGTPELQPVRQLTLMLPGITLNLPADISPRWLATLLREIAP